MLSTLLATVVLAAAPSLDVKVDGEGYLRFARDGRVVYAKTAALTVVSGKIAVAGGAVLLPTVPAPQDAQALDVDLQGNLFAIGSQGRAAIGRIVLAVFPEGAVLSPANGLLTSPERPSLGNPGEGLNGVIRAGGQASPNVQPVKTPKAAPKTPPNPPKNPTGGGPKVPPGTVQIDVSQTSETAAEQITLGDVAQISADSATATRLNAVALGKTPTGAVGMPVTRARILAALKSAGFDPTGYVINVPLRATVSRKTAKVTHQQFIDAAIGYAASVTPGSHFTSRDQARDYVAPDGQMELRVEQYSATPMGASVTVGVYVDGRRCNSRTVRLEATGADGGPLIRVNAGLRVKILIRSNDATVQVYGKLVRTGAVGQTVEVTTDKKTRHTGVLVAPDTVEVKL